MNNIAPNVAIYFLRVVVFHCRKVIALKTQKVLTFFFLSH